MRTARAGAVETGALVLVVVAGAGLRAGGADEAVRAIEKMGGRITLRGVNLSGTEVTDTSLSVLKGLTGLRELYLRNTSVTDAGLKELKGLTGLRILILRGTSVTDAGLRELKGHPLLLVVDLSGTKVTDTGVQDLEKARPGLQVDYVPAPTAQPPTFRNRMVGAIAGGPGSQSFPARGSLLSFSTILATATILVGLFLVSSIVAVQARQRGYRFLIWVIAGMLGNPIFFLVLLAIMPDFARKALRRKVLADLEARLAGRPKVLPAAPAPAPAPSPLRPTGQASAVPSDRSLGDQPTILPPERSLGDEETRG